MFEYKSKYNQKASSVYGVPTLCIIRELIKNTGIGCGSSILIPNCNDGLYVIPFAKRGYTITCYEENKSLLYGGEIDNFFSLGLVNRLRGANLQEKVNINNYNFYSLNKDNDKYDLVLAIRTLQLKENDKYDIITKIQKLANSVKDNGFLYLNYYLNEDEEISSRQLLYQKSVLDLFEKENWNIIYYRENISRPTKHGSHPYNRKEHRHSIGSLLLQKTPYSYKKRIINRAYKKGSIYGDANQQVYDYINFLRNEYKRKIDVLIVDANDGKNVIPFANKGFKVTCYEDNDILLNGGMYDGRETNGIKKRILDYKISENITLKELNYYEKKEVNKYDFIFVENSLNLEKNQNISMRKKVRKLMSNVREGGFLYICYYLCKEENKLNNSYLNYGQMKTFFDLEDWEIIYIREKNINMYYNNENRKEKGYIFARKKRNRRKHKNCFSIEICSRIQY